MALYFIIPLCAALINRLRGWGPSDYYVNSKKPVPKWSKFADHLTSKGMCGAYFAILAYFVLESFISAAWLGSAFVFWAIWGLGDYFDFSDKKNDEIGFIDNLVIKVLKPGPANDLASMTLRGVVFAYPFFIAASFFDYALSWLFGSLFWLQGILYMVFKYYLRRFLPYGIDHILSELVVGGIIWGGVLLGMRYV